MASPEPRQIHATRSSPNRWHPRVALWAVLLICCGLPLAWLALQLVIHPQVIVAAVPDAFRWRLIARTFGFNACAATLATLVALPVAVTLGLSRSRWTRALWVVLPVPLLMPSLVLTYGWKQAHAWVGGEPMPQSKADVARCVVALASWLWPVPAIVVAFALRQLDANLLLHARLDGATGRIVARLAAAPVLLGWLGALLLSLQEFAVFEPTGISVIATEVRAVFETGASLNGDWSMLPVAAHESQADRMAAALAVMLPSLLGTLLIAVVGRRLVRSLADGVDWHGHDAAPPVRLPRFVPLLAVASVSFALGIPIYAMIRSLHARFEPLRIVDEYRPQLLGSIGLAAAAAGIGATCMMVASAWPTSRRAVTLSLASFLIGGQWTAIALIVAFNRPGLWWAYDSATMPIVAYVGRFAWIGLCAAALTWSPGARWARDLAATDGAGRWASWRYVVAPLAWPLLAGAGVLMFTLSLTEVPATTLLQPAQTLVPMLMTWAHILNYDAMIEASLLLASVVTCAGVVVAVLVRLAGRMQNAE